MFIMPNRPMELQRDQEQGIGQARGLYGRIGRMNVPTGDAASNGLDSMGRAALGPMDDSMFHRAAQMSLIDPEMMAGEAATDQQMATTKGMDSMKRDLQRYGINPNSGRFAGLMQKATLQGAADKAGAATRARMAGRDMNAARSLQMAGAENARNSLNTSRGLGLLSAARHQSGQELEAARLRSANMATAAGGLRATASDYGEMGGDAAMALHAQGLSRDRQMAQNVQNLMQNASGRMIWNPAISQYVRVQQ
jgi:hypothetical protein